MPLREGPPQPPPPAGEHKMAPVDGPIVYAAEKARGGEIILRTPARRPARRIVFIAGLASVFVLVLPLQLFA